MSSLQSSAAIPAPTPLVPAAPRAGRAIEELWLAIGPRAWRTLVVVPVGPEASAGRIARGLAAASADLGDGAVTFVPGDEDVRAAIALVDAGTSAARVIAAAPSALAEPRGAVLAQRADAVVLCVTRGRTRLAEVELTAELVGRGRVLGCVLVG